jgi:hypothetical protein
MINNDVNAGNFIYCMTHWGPYESKQFYNVGNGLYHEYTYLIDGNLKIEFRNTPEGEIVEVVDSKTAGYKLLDHTKKEAKYETVITEAEGTTAMFFNPIAETRRLDVNIVEEGSHTIVAKDKRITIVCIVSSAMANSQKILSMQHAIVFPGKTAELVIPKHGVCALVSYSDDLDKIIELI